MAEKNFQVTKYEKITEDIGDISDVTVENKLFSSTTDDTVKNWRFQSSATWKHNAGTEESIKSFISDQLSFLSFQIEATIGKFSNTTMLNDKLFKSTDNVKKNAIETAKSKHFINILWDVVTSEQTVIIFINDDEVYKVNLPKVDDKIFDKIKRNLLESF